MLGNTEETGKIDHIQVEESQQVASLPEQIVSIDQSIFDAKGNVKSVRRHRAVYFAMSALLAILVALHYGHVLTMPLVVQIGVWVLLILFFFIGGLGTDPEKAQAQVDKLENNKRIYLSFLNISTDEAYFDRLVKINVENLSEYYSLVKVHTGQSFNLSLIVSVVGFVMISAGLVAGFVKEDLRNISYLSAASGVVVEFIAGVMFYLYSQTVRQLKGYHDSLLDVQNILLSFKLIEGTSDEKERSAMTQKMIEFLATRK